MPSVTRATPSVGSGMNRYLDSSLAKLPREGGRTMTFEIDHVTHLQEGVDYTFDTSADSVLV
jgi:hypothetical protein